MEKMSADYLEMGSAVALMLSIKCETTFTFVLVSHIVLCQDHVFTATNDAELVDDGQSCSPTVELEKHHSSR